MRWKIEQYRRNGVKLVSLYPTELSSLCTDSSVGGLRNFSVIRTLGY
ncbi:MAG: hypothetical protein JRM76_06870 [Nitrososphaerota archaeon]|nr:hypothetical protein [Nitrososphaerota archaeon]MDG6992946.1 hypothetical protein [Nitrososphaerota archaeon]